jgi:olefin beta-lactone synthetase
MLEWKLAEKSLLFYKGPKMNISRRFEQQAQLNPQKPALVLSKRSLFSREYQYQSLSFEQLFERVLSITQGLRALGLKRGERVVLFIKPGPYLAPLTFALFRIGLVPVFIDPGMGKTNLLRCLVKAQPSVMIAEPIVHLIKLFYPKAFASIRISLKPSALAKMEAQRADERLRFCEETEPHELAAILFTSGGTGEPKGVCYDHALFDTQTTLLQQMFGLNASERDCPGFPLFSLFTLCMGMTSVLPDLNAAKPASVKPERVVKQILEQECSFLAGSPAIWERVAQYCLEQQITLPSVRWVVMFGAPVSIEIHQAFQKILPMGNTYTPYGATEALPVSLIDGKTILNHYQKDMESGRGWAIGQPVQGVSVKIIPITDDIIHSLDQAPPLKANEVGEIIVQGPVVTREYDGLKEATALAKIDDPKHGFFHRMGDIGHLDEHGALWFGGRKSHRVSTRAGLLSSSQCEAIFDSHPRVKRSALIGLGEGENQTPAIVIEPKEKQFMTKKYRVQLLEELSERAQQNTNTQGIQKFYFTTPFPVDVRHNIKIDRLKLKKMVELGELQ